MSLAASITPNNNNNPITPIAAQSTAAPSVSASAAVSTTINNTTSADADLNNNLTKPTTAPGLAENGRPILYTTVVDIAPEYAGMAGPCDFLNCECRFYYGNAGKCGKCSHANLYHQVKARREDIEARARAEAKRKQKHFKRAEREARELAAKLAAELALKPAIIHENRHPCSVEDCECKRFDPILTAAAQARLESIESESTYQLLLQTDPTAAAEYEHQRTEARLAAAQLKQIETEAEIEIRSRLTAQQSDPNYIALIGTLPVAFKPINSSTIPITPTPELYKPPERLRIALSGQSAEEKQQLDSTEIPSTDPPRICRKCKHGELYHIKQSQEKKKFGFRNAGGQNGNNKKTTATTTTTTKKR